MRKLIRFIIRNKVLLIFLSLLLISSMIMSYEAKNESFNLRDFTTDVIGKLSNLQNKIAYLPGIYRLNEKLVKENEHYHSMIINLQSRLQDSINNRVESFYFSDSNNIATNWDLIVSNVLDNSLFRNKNYIIIDKGISSGIKDGMGAVNNEGIVGIVKHCSYRYCILYSLLHEYVSISSKVKKSNRICSIEWNNNDHTMAKLLFLTKDILIEKGDTIVTSGYSDIFPPNIVIGVVDEVIITPEEKFQQIDIRLSTDFSTLDYLYIIKNFNRKERDSLRELVFLDTF